VAQRVTAALEGGKWAAARPGRTLPPGKTRYPFYRRLGEPPGPVWMGGKPHPHRDSIPDRPARSSVAIPTELPDRQGNRNGYGKSVAEEREKRESRKQKIQKVSRGKEKKRRAEKAEKYRERKKNWKFWGYKTHCTYYKETEKL